jgi:hypothetical protein
VAVVSDDKGEVSAEISITQGPLYDGSGVKV